MKHLAWVPAALCALPALALEPAVLESVIVSASREGTALRDTPAAVATIPPTAVSEKKATFAGQLLNQAAGVYVSDLANEQHSMSIRQPITTNAFYLYLEDGVPIRPVGLFNHNALYEINLAGVGRVEVIKGPASSLYGGNAVGGAVNFLTRSPSATPEIFVGAQMSDQGYRRLDVGASNSSTDSAYRLSAYTFERQGGWQEHNDANKQALTLRHDFVVSPEATLKTILSHNRLYTEMPGTLFKSDYDTRPGTSYHTFTWRKVDATRISTALEGNWNAGGLTTLTLYARDNTTDQLPSYLIFNTGSTTAAGRTSDQHSSSFGFDARHRQDLARTLRVIAGLTGETTPMQAQEVNLAITRDPASRRYTAFTRGTVRRDYAVDITSLAAYTQLEFAPLDTVRIVAGLRHDALGYDYRNHLVPSATTGAPDEQRRYQHTSPKLGVTWDVAPRINLYANASQGFTPPEVSAQYGGAQVAPTLREAVFDNLDVGVRYLGPDKIWSGDVSVYRLTGRDEIVSYTLTPGQSEPRNAGKTRHEGLEFALAFNPRTAWDAKLNGAYARHVFADYRTGPTENFSGNIIPAAPRWLVNAEVGIKPAAGSRISAEAQYVGAYFMDNSNTVRYPGHAVLNLRATTRVGAWEWWAAVMNATDRHYAELAASSFKGSGARNPDTQDTYTPGAPRTLLIGARYQFGATR